MTSSGEAEIDDGIKATNKEDTISSEWVYKNINSELRRRVILKTFYYPLCVRSVIILLICLASYHSKTHQCIAWQTRYSSQFPKRGQIPNNPTQLSGSTSIRTDFLLWNKCCYSPHRTKNELEHQSKNSGIFPENMFAPRLKAVTFDTNIQAHHQLALL